MEFYFFEIVLAIIVVIVTWIGCITCMAIIKWIWTLVKCLFGYMVEKRESTSKDNQWKYDVFLSFRGPDTRKGITFELYDRLQSRGIKTFMDDRDLEVGDDISPRLLKAIEESRFAIVVLSENYASSTWCLEELAKICECMEDNNRILPLFYKVDPADVRFQNKSFKDAFTKHEKSGRHKNKVQKWKAALKTVAKFSGWNLNCYEMERQLVEASVEYVCSKVGSIQFNTGDFEEFEATRQAIDKVIKALKDDEVTVVGVYGMGGVGKTTMVKFISDQARKDGIFRDVIMAMVSQRPDVKNIQGILADLLRIELKDETVDGRAVRLRREIMRRNKMLIILDDIWVRMDLSRIGIPSYEELQNCTSKVLLTTRNLHVCESMDSKPNIVLNVLSEQDSWNFFVRISKLSFEKPSCFYDVARNVARGCAGLPIALEAIAKALRDKKMDEWNEAAERLKSTQPSNPGDERDVFKCIKLSYDYLRSEDAKSLFLLCCLFPDDYDIQIEDLLTYGFGKGLFQECNTLQEARDICQSLVRSLKSSSLLLGTEHDGRVRMHDVIRDVAISISSSEDGQRVLVKAGCNLKNWPKINSPKGYCAVSLMMNKFRKLPKELVCSELQILLLQHNGNVDDIPDSFFESLDELRVLDLSKTSISVLPPSFCLLNNLHTLYLDSCEKFFDMSVLRTLKKLEILSLRECGLKEVPEEIGHLTKLRMLDITESRIVKIASKVISCLRELEELYMQCSFVDWGSKFEEGGEETNLHFDELTGLLFLTTLKVGISDPKFLPETVEVNPNWQYFDICIGTVSEVRQSTWKSRFFLDHSRTLTLSTTIHTLPYWFIDVVTEQAEKLEYRNCKGLKNVLVEYNNGRLRELKYLVVYGCHEDLKELMNAETWDPNEPVFKKLEELHLSEVDNIKMLCVGELPPGSLCNLKVLDVRWCHKLVNVLVQSTLLERLQYLEKLCCAHMDGLEYVFGSGKTIKCEKLQEMRLCYLPNLIKIWNGHAPHAIFHHLKILAVSGCKKLKSLFTSNVAQCLSQLEDLWVYSCFSLDRLVEASEETENSTIIFPKLNNLVLAALPQLRRLYSNSSGSATSLDIEFPSLEHFHTWGCPLFEPNIASNYYNQKQVQVDDSQHYSFLKKRLWGNIEIESTISEDGMLNMWDFESFEATIQAMNEVMIALKDNKVTAIGVYGMGGVGKTTMVKHVGEQACKNGIFDRVIMTVISQSPDLRGIQGALADLLGVKLEEETEIGRAARLRMEIMRRNKILIILDDIWMGMDLSRIGIPSYKNLQRCNSKVLLTTRNLNVCHAMNSQVNIPLSVLSEKDSWTLFVKSGRRSFESTSFEDVARKVARECAGLPVSLIAVARALEDKDLVEWEKAARRLEMSQTANLDDFEDVYNCIKLSYDYLKNDDCKLCFLLCSQFPEDHEIQIEDLFKSAIENRLFQDAKTVDEAKETAELVVMYLISCSMLLDGEQKGCVRMHPVVRDAAMRIALSEDVKFR